MPTAAIATELRGLALPATRGSSGGFFESKGPYDTAWGDLLLAVFTPQGGRPMRRSFGTTLYDLLFSPIAEEFEIVRLIIQDTVTRLLPHILLRDVTVISDAKRTVRVGITFSLLADLENEERRTVLIQKSYISSLQGAV